MNRSYIPRQTGLNPVKSVDGTKWMLELPSGEILESRKVRERDAFKELYDQFWAIRRMEVLERDRFQCRACGSCHSLSVDHIMSRGSGGTDDMSNLRTLCVVCHDKRHSYGWKENGQETT